MSAQSAARGAWVVSEEAEREEARQFALRVAMITAAFYREMVGNGISGDEALGLTEIFLERWLEALFGGRR